MSAPANDAANQPRRASAPSATIPAPAALEPGDAPVPAPAPFPDRRGFLRTSAGGSVAVALASLLPAGCAADYPQADEDGASLSVLTAKEYAVLRAASESILAGVAVPPGEVAAEIDRELAAVGDPILGDMKSVLGLIEHLTVLGLHRGTFTELRPDQRLRYLDGWARSRFGIRRAAYQALRGFITYFGYVRDETRPITGFTGPYPPGLIPPVPVGFGEVV